MDAEQEIQKLRGEAIATQMVLIGIGIGMVNLGAPFKTIVEQAFDYADRIFDVGADKFGKSADQEHLKSAYSVLEQLRTAILGSDGEPKASV